MTRSAIAALSLAAATVRPAPAHAQESAARSNGTVYVFLDCRTRLCDFDHLRRSIPVVNWVHDRQDADIHVLVTQQGTGSGGSEYTLAFIGLRHHANRRYTLRHVSSPDDTFDEARADLARVLQLGLGPYLAETRAGRSVTIRYTVAETTAFVPEDDPWDFWVFRLSVNGGMNGESQERFIRGSASASASRVTDAFKLSLRANASGFRSEFDVFDSTVTPPLDTTYVSSRESYGFEALAVWSLGPHWSWGIFAEAQRNTRLNWDAAVRGGPAVEYDIFPYDESTRRIITLRYIVGLAAFDYRDTTIFFETAEVRPAHVLQVDLGITEPWGGINVRLVRGLDFNVGAEVSRIKDQLYLPKEDLTPAEVLLQQRQRGTDFQFGMNAGLSFRFGSKFNNVVNPRMR